MDKLFFFTQHTTPGAAFPIAFSSLSRQFLNETDPKTGGRYYNRWAQDNEPLEVVLDDFLRDKVQIRIDTAANFHQLLEALILFLEGGDYGQILDQDAEESFARYKNELDEIQIERTRVFGAGPPIYDPLVGGYGSGDYPAPVPGIFHPGDDIDRLIDEKIEADERAFREMEDSIEDDLYIRENPYSADPDTEPGGPIK